MPDSSNFPNKMMSLVHLNNHTRLVDRVSGQDSDFLAGTVVLRLIRAVMTPPGSLYTKGRRGKVSGKNDLLRGVTGNGEATGDAL